MSIFLSIVLGVFALIALIVLLGLFWLARKAKLAEGYVVYAALSLGVEALKQHIAKPENASDAEAAALLARAEAAQKSGKAILDKRDVKGAVAQMVPAIEELGKFKAALDKKRAEAAAPAPAIEVTPLLPAPATAEAVTSEGATPDTVGGAADQSEKK